MLALKNKLAKTKQVPASHSAISVQAYEHISSYGKRGRGKKSGLPQLNTCYLYFLKHNTFLSQIPCQNQR